MSSQWWQTLSTIYECYIIVKHNNFQHLYLNSVEAYLKKVTNCNVFGFTSKDGADVPSSYTPFTHELSQAHLQEEDRHASCDQADEVRHQKRACNTTPVK